MTFPGADGGIGIAEGFTLDKSALTLSEMRSILLGLKSLASVMAGTQISTLLRKLSHEPDRFIALKDDIIIDLASHYADSLAPKISLLKQAIASRVAVKFDYYSKTEREVAESHYELRAVTEEQANLEAFYSDPETKRYAMLLVSRSLEYVLVDQYGPGSYEAVDEDTLRAKWDYVNEAEMVKTILGLGGGAKVIEPQSLADAVEAEAKRILGRYQRRCQGWYGSFFKEGACGKEHYDEEDRSWREETGSLQRGLA